MLTRLKSRLPIRPKRLRQISGLGCRLRGLAYVQVRSRQEARYLGSITSARRVILHRSLPPWTAVLTHSPEPPMPAPGPKIDVAEAFALHANQQGITVRAHDQHGLTHGVHTLAALLHAPNKRLPGFRLEDWPSLALRGVMVDVARQAESVNSLKGLAERLAAVRCNQLMLYFENRLALSRHPRLHAPVCYSLSSLKRLARHCDRLGMELVPCFATLGHCEQFLQVPQYRDLADGNRIYQVNPLHSGTRRLVRDMFDDWRIVNPRMTLIHTACDEAPYMGHCRQTRDFIRRHGKERFFADYLNWQHAELSRMRVRMMIWGDMLKHYPGVLDMIPRDIIICDWNYGTIGAPDRKAMRLFQRHGFEVVVTPAASRSAQIHAPDEQQLRHNIPRFTQLAVEMQAKGVLCSQWECFTRFTRLSEPGFRLACRLGWEGTGFSSATRRREALQQTFGGPGRGLDRTLRRLSPTPMLKRFQRLHFDKTVPAKTYHVDTHEMVPTHPLLYLKDSLSTWEHRLQQRYEQAHADVLRHHKSQRPAERILRFTAQSLLLQAWKRAKMSTVGVHLREAYALLAGGRRHKAALALQQAFAATQELHDLGCKVHSEARGVWALERVGADPAYARVYGQRLRFLVQGSAHITRALERAMAQLKADKRCTLWQWLAARPVIRFRLDLRSQEEVNIVRLRVETSRDGRTWCHDRQVGAFQQPGSVYDYYWMPLGEWPRWFRVHVEQTRTEWTPRELTISAWQLQSAYTERLPDEAEQVRTEEYAFTEDLRQRYVRVRCSQTSAKYRLQS